LLLPAAVMVVIVGFFVFLSIYYELERNVDFNNQIEHVYIEYTLLPAAAGSPVCSIYGQETRNTKTGTIRRRNGRIIDGNMEVRQDNKL